MNVYAGKLEHSCRNFSDKPLTDWINDMLNVERNKNTPSSWSTYISTTLFISLFRPAQRQSIKAPRENIIPPCFSSVLCRIHEQMSTANPHTQQQKDTAKLPLCMAKRFLPVLARQVVVPRPKTSNWKKTGSLGKKPFPILTSVTKCYRYMAKAKAVIYATGTRYRPTQPTCAKHQHET